MAKSTSKYAIAVDFDGVIADDSAGYRGAGKFGAPVEGVVKALKSLKSRGCRIIIHTCRYESNLIISYCREHGIVYDEINRNSDEIVPGAGEQKPIADVYVDARGVQFRDWDQTIRDIDELLERKGKASYRSR